MKNAQPTPLAIILPLAIKGVKCTVCYNIYHVHVHVIQGSSELQKICKTLWCL